MHIPSIFPLKSTFPFLNVVKNPPRICQILFWSFFVKFILKSFQLQEIDIRLTQPHPIPHKLNLHIHLTLHNQHPKPNWTPHPTLNNRNSRFFKQPSTENGLIFSFSLSLHFQKVHLWWWQSNTNTHTHTRELTPKLWIWKKL